MMVFIDFSSDFLPLKCLNIWIMFISTIVGDIDFKN